MSLVLLKNLAPKLRPRIDVKLLYRHASKGTNNFPEVKKQLGIHKFYEEDEIREWWSLWIEVTKGHRAGAEKRRTNGSR